MKRHLSRVDRLQQPYAAQSLGILQSETNAQNIRLPDPPTDGRGIRSKRTQVVRQLCV